MQHLGQNIQHLLKCFYFIMTEWFFKVMVWLQKNIWCRRFWQLAKNIKGCHAPSNSAFLSCPAVTAGSQSRTAGLPDRWALITILGCLWTAVLTSHFLLSAVELIKNDLDVNFGPLWFGVSGAGTFQKVTYARIHCVEKTQRSKRAFSRCQPLLYLNYYGFGSF